MLLLRKSKNLKIYPKNIIACTFVLHLVQRAFFLEELEQVEDLSILGNAHRNIL